MGTKCCVIFSGSGPPDVLWRFCLATINPEFLGAERSCNFYFSREALAPCGPDKDPYEVWGCRNDVCMDITLSDMGGHPGCDSIEFFFETNHDPPIYWFYKVVELYPQSEFHLCYDILRSDSI